MDIDIDPQIEPTHPTVVAGLVVKPANVKSVNELLGGGLILTPGQLKEAEALATGLDMHNSTSVLSFGVKAQERLSKTAENLIGHTKNKDSGGAVSEALTSLVGVVRGFPSKQFGGPSNPVGWLVAKFVDPAQKLMDRFDRSAKQIDSIITHLQKDRVMLESDIQGLDNLFHDSVGQYLDLTVYIVAGKMRIDKERKELDGAKKIDIVDPLKFQERKEKEEKVEMLERKVNDLELTRTITLQTLPQIRMIQEVDKMLLQKIDSSIITTIPIWKTQVAMSITAFRQKQAIAAQNALADATNKLLMENASMVKDNVVGGKKALERGVVDVETLETVSATLISAVTESLEITKEARQKRDSTSKQLATLEGKLTKALGGSSVQLEDKLD